MENLMSSTAPVNQDPIFGVRGLTKSYGARTVVKGLDFDIFPGEVIALLGENGAGKSTTKNMICGLVTPTGGEIRVDGQQISNPGDAAHGVGAVHQELSLFSTLTVAENICISHLPGQAYRLDLKAMRHLALDQLALLGVDLDPDALVESLGAGQQQIVEIAKALLGASRLLILDEPTTSLTAPEREKLFSIIDTLTKRGLAIVFISHFMDEVMRISDRYVVLRDGEQIAQGLIADTPRAELEAMMVGRAIGADGATLTPHSVDEALGVAGLSSPDFHDISFSVARGEILGLSGLMGAGRTEVAEAIFGLRPVTGEVRVDGRRIVPLTVQSMKDAGVAYLPEDRRGNGLFLGRPVRENISAGVLHHLIDRIIPGFGYRGERRATEQVARSVHLSAPHIEAPISALSGGNQQKALFGRWLAMKPKVCILDEPTKGVDIAARAEIHDQIVRLAAAGVAVIVISSDLPELIQIAHRIGVIRAGHLVGFVDRADFDPVRIISLAAASAQTGKGGNP